MKMTLLHCKVQAYFKAFDKILLVIYKWNPRLNSSSSGYRNSVWEGDFWNTKIKHVLNPNITFPCKSTSILHSSWNYPKKKKLLIRVCTMPNHIQKEIQLEKWQMDYWISARHLTMKMYHHWWIRNKKHP